MVLTTVCRTSLNLNCFKNKSLLFALDKHRYKPVTTHKSYQSTVPPRLLQKTTNCSNGWSISVRHAHKLVDLNKLNLPKKLISWKHLIELKWKLGDKFVTEEFFTGVMESFLYTTECIAHGHNEALQDILTDDAKEDIPYYMMDAQSNNRDLYIITEKEIVLVKVTGIEFKQEAEFNKLRDVTVLSAYVWIAYMKDCLKLLESSNPGSDTSWSDIRKNFKEMQQKMQEHSRHAEFQFQRAYDQKLTSALTDWLIAKVTYKIPKRFDEQ